MSLLSQEPSARVGRKGSLAGLAEIYKIGLGPSSSHTIGPMRAARFFIDNLKRQSAPIMRLRATAYGSLAFTGAGHATDKAMILGLAGMEPGADPDSADALFAHICEEKKICLPDGRLVPFDPEKDVVFDYERTFPRHPNAMQFEALDADGKPLYVEVWYSVGGGFVECDGAQGTQDADSAWTPPYPYETASALLSLAAAHGLKLADLILANESARRGQEATLLLIDKLAATMRACMERGLAREGNLAGAIQIKRRARMLYAQFCKALPSPDPNRLMQGVSIFAIAVAEENAAGGRIVTAPTNGAAGVVPAVLRYYQDYCGGANEAGVRDFFLVSAAIGALIKHNASISGAEVGCQGEIGAASSMAAAGLCAALGGTNAQIENAAEIALEHHLGMTCDPVGGLVQVPCIERNAFGAVKAINAASLALMGDGTHFVSLDQVIATMRETGLDMNAKYKETAQGGLAAFVRCGLCT